MRLKDKVAIITGAGSGIGRATAVLFAKEGAKVVVADFNPETGKEAVKMIKDSGGDALFINVDVSKKTDVNRMVDTTIKNYGKINILFNNAGIIEFYLGELGTVTDISEEVWDKILNTNLKGVFLGSKYAIPEMLKSGGGVIINTSSTAGVTSYPQLPAYTAAKGGIVTLTRNMAIDYASKNIRVNCICPGGVATHMTNAHFAALGGPEKERQEAEKAVPVGRYARPEEIANAVLFLASDESSYITGHALVIDGGMTAL